MAGPIGCGKTTMVLCWGWAGSAPPVYVNCDLRRRANAPLTPRDLGELKREVLLQLGIPASALLPIGPELDVQYLRATAERQITLIVENAIQVSEIAALTPCSPTSLMLVTVRQLTGELRDAYDFVVLDGLDDDGALDLLAHSYGRHHLDSELEEAKALLDYCDRMPWPLRMLGVELGRRVDEDGAVSSVLAGFRATDLPRFAESITGWAARSCSQLPEPIMRDVAALAGHPGQEFTRASASYLLGHAADDAIAALQDAGLLAVGIKGRFRLHQHVHNYAVEYAGRFDIDLDHFSARTVTYYADNAVAGDHHAGDRLRAYGQRRVAPWSLSGPPGKWMVAERHVWPDLVATAYRMRRDVDVCQLCGALELLMLTEGEHDLYAIVNEYGILSAERSGNPRLIVRAHQAQSRAHRGQHQFELASSELAIAEQFLKACSSDYIDRQDYSSVSEFRGDLYLDIGQAENAAAAYRRSVAVDQEIDDKRSFSIDARKLAKSLVVMGGDNDLAEALRWLDAAEPAAAEEVRTHGPRNLGRLRMVRADALTAMNNISDAKAEYELADQDIEKSGSRDNYWIELNDIAGRIAFLSGDAFKAREYWQPILDYYIKVAHPRMSDFQQKVNGCEPIDPKKESVFRRLWARPR
ncbi:MAG TPA: hypothetical protein VHX38_32855 [Pseudonocardiaceae bacterium]|nr:hypothetical protein [Pseudonocardiaceae bacterium]